MLAKSSNFNTINRCLVTFGRHSNSIDVTKKVCGSCRGPLNYLGRFLPDGTPAKARAATGFSLFVKEHFANGEGMGGRWQIDCIV